MSNKHSHMCPECFRLMLCEDDCSTGEAGDYHNVICDKCLSIPEVPEDLSIFTDDYIDSLDIKQMSQYINGFWKEDFPERGPWPTYDNIEEMSELMRKMSTLGFSLTYVSIHKNESFNVNFVNPSTMAPTKWGFGDTLPLAITRGALRFLVMDRLSKEKKKR